MQLVAVIHTCRTAYERNLAHGIVREVRFSYPKNAEDLQTKVYSSAVKHRVRQATVETLNGNVALLQDGRTLITWKNR